MPVYRYRAVRLDGEPAEGVIEEASAERAAARLREQGYQVNAVEEEKPRAAFARAPRPLSLDDIHVFNEQLLAIAKSGLPFSDALRSLAADIRRPNLKRNLDRLQEHIERGASLADALDAEPGNFPLAYRAAIRAGERSGNLSNVLEQLCAHSDRMLELKHSAGETLAYPCLVAVVGCAIVAFVMVKVVPVFAEILADFGTVLPPPTRFLLGCSNAVVRHGASLALAVAAVVVAVVVLLRVVRRSGSGGYMLDWFALHAPLFGRRVKQAAIARFSRTLELLLGSRAPIVESLVLAAHASGNVVFRRALLEAAGRVEKGETVADALRATGLFPHMYCWMLGNAERQGNVEAALQHLAATSEQDVMRRDRALLVVFEPVLIVALAFIVGFIIVSLYLPIFTLGDAVGGL